MAIVYPNAAIASRWNGALQARLLRAPLEEFLTTRGIAPAAAGLSQDSDNVARATVLLLDPGLALFHRGQPQGLAPHQRAFVGHLACVASNALAQSISQRSAWRIAALLSGARLLGPWVGLTEAALTSAASVRDFRTCAGESSSVEPRIAAGVLATLTGSSDAAAELSAHIASRLGDAAAGAPSSVSSELIARLAVVVRPLQHSR
jgi:hypothetical protein